MNDLEIIVNNEKLNILFTFNDNNNNYVVYLDKENDICASKYISNNNTIELLEITTNEEWDLIDQKLDEMRD